jgi:RHS repeat-associated protein
LIGHSLVNLPESQRFYCKNHLATEVHGAITFSILQSGDQLLAQRRHEKATLDVTLLASEQHRSVLYSLQADASRAIAFSPYGHRSGEGGVISLLGFNGERPDTLTGHYLLGNGYRAFNPVLMRFNSSDSLSPFGKGGVNAYTYCLGDPINNSDPTGHIVNPFTLLAMTKSWVAKAKANLSLPVGGRVSRFYYVSPSAVESLRIAIHSPHALPTKPQMLWNRARRDRVNPDISIHVYPSGVVRQRIVDRTEAGRWFDATSGAELDAIRIQPDHPQHTAFQSAYPLHSEINFQNHVSVAAPHVDGVFANANPNHLLARLQSGLSGNVPGVMPSVVVKDIRGASHTGLTRRQLAPRLLDQTRNRG